MFTGLRGEKIVGLALGLVLALGCALGYGTLRVSALDKSGYITEDAAKKIALDYTGADQSDLRFVESSFYSKKGIVRYDFEFLSGNTKYSCEVDAVSGQVIACYTKSIHNSGGSGGSSSTSQSYIGLEKAKETALAHAGVSAANTRKLKADLDYDDGRAIYEVEFKYNRMDYEYEIDAVTGDILYWEYDD